jgi:hypothetical protein
LWWFVPEFDIVSLFGEENNSGGEDNVEAYMKLRPLIPLLTCAALLATAAILQSAARHRAAAAMAEGAKNFLAGLTPEQRAKATFDFGDNQRLDWHYVPRARKGIPLKEMDAKQRKLAQEFLKTGLSQSGYVKATTIMELETILREIEQGKGSVRDPELYYFTVFGTPSAKDRWGWRVEGHHLSLNFTVVNGTLVATTPSFFGANPAEVKQGPRKGLRTLSALEDLARELLNKLDDKQRAQAVFNTTAPREIVTGHEQKVNPLDPAGIPASQLKPEQTDLLKKLLDAYAATMADDLAAERLEKVRRAGFEKIHFAWAGGAEPGQPHYYRIQGPTFLIEYDNTQNNANHIHSVWRDFDGDFGKDLLREHYRNASHPQ